MNYKKAFDKARKQLTGRLIAGCVLQRSLRGSNCWYVIRSIKITDFQNGRTKNGNHRVAKGAIHVVERQLLPRFCRPYQRRARECQGGSKACRQNCFNFGEINRGWMTGDVQMGQVRCRNSWYDRKRPRLLEQRSPRRAGSCQCPFQC
jgi:hypothetical protein